MAGRGKTYAMLALLAAAAFANLADLTSGHAASADARPPDEYRVIVHPGNRQRALTRSFVRSVYLKKTTAWWDGQTIRPVGLSRRFPARERFVREVLNKTPAQLRAYWNQQIFSGKGVPPPDVDSEAAVIAHVLRNPGAIGYLPATADPGSAAVVNVK